MPQFFVSCQLGFEKELVTEMKEFWFEMIDLDGLPTRTAFPAEFEILQGGVEFDVPEHLGYQINFFSKLANRVLLRIHRFEARYFDQLEKVFQKLKWSQWFAQAAGLKSLPIKLKIESHKSRLNNEKNMTEAIQNAVKSHQLAIANDSLQTVYLRIEKDRGTISLDTSGEHLHRRGYGVYRGEAPIRETLAAYMVRRLQQQVALNENLLLVDPFVGSGTLLFEALTQKQPLFEKDYAFLHWANTPKLFKSTTWKKNYRWLATNPRMSVLGADIDPKCVLNSQKNLELLKSLFGLSEAQAQFIQQDSQQLKITEKKSNQTVWAIANPPYGERLNDGNALNVLESLEEKIDGLVVVHPLGWKFKFKKLKSVSSEDFNNQGLALKLSIFRS